MRKLQILIAGLTLVPSLYAALPAATVWEVRATGADTNGGCFIAGSTGTDYSQQNAAQFSGTTLATTATATVVSSSTHVFAATDVGNCIHITAGTGFTVGFYQIVSVASGQATLDRAPAAASVTGGTWDEGGALANPQTALSNVTASNVVWVTGSYSNTAALAISVAGPSHFTTTTPASRLLGYGTTRGDSGRFTITLASGSGYAAINATVGGWIVGNVNTNCNGLATATGISATSGLFLLRNATISNCSATNGSLALTGTNTQAHNVEVTGNSGSYSVVAGNASGSTRLSHLWIHDNTVTNAGIRMVGAGSLKFSVISNNSNTNTDGIAVAATIMADVSNNTVYNAGRNGINVTATSFDGGWIHDNLIVGSGGYGLVGAGAAGRGSDMDIDGNAYYNNALGNRNNADDTSVNPQNAGDYTNSLDVILTANPFTNPNSNDFTLNTVAGGGLAVRGTATPGAIAGLSQQGYMDFGALQAQGGAVTTTACTTTGRAYAQ